MKVILLQDVAKIGRRGDIAEVPNGYAQNKLVPQGMAKPATPANLKQASALQAQAISAQASDEANFKTMAEQLKDTVITVTVDANEKGHLFQAVKAEEIIADAAAQGIVVPAGCLELKQPIKDIGTHEIQLTHGTDLQTTMNIEVIAK